MVEVNKSEDLWSSYKNLKKLVWKHLNEDVDNSSISEFENILRKHKQNFFTLLQNQPKNGRSREDLKKGMIDGIVIKGLGHQILSRELYQETIILSDMYEMNEFVALDLLCTAQIQMPHYPGLPRGLVAVLLYYDGRKSLVSTLRYLVQARVGVQWCLNISNEVETFITTYTDQLMEGGLFNRIFELLKTLDLSKEIEKLQENLALGGAKHRRQVTDLFKDIRNILADIVFTWSTQSGLPKVPTLSLINYLRNVVIEEEATGILDNVNLYLLMALLSAFDLSVLHSREDGEKAVLNLPILSDLTYIDAIIAELLPTKPKWKCEGLQATSTFSLAVCIASLRLIPQNQKFQNAINQEEIFIDLAIEMNVFEFMYNIIFENKQLYTEQFLYKCMHHLLRDFIVYMYPKVKELRIKADEIARTVQIYRREGIEAPPNLPRYFEYLLLTIGKFYLNDKLNTEYVLNFWNPSEIQYNSETVGNIVNRTLLTLTARTVSLFKFVRLAGDMLPTTLFVPYITMLSSLCSCQQAARYCFNMLRQAGQQLTSTLSWDHFFQSFAQYYYNLRQEMLPISDTIYRSTYYKGVSPQELEGLHAVLLLIRTVAEHDEFSRLAFTEHPGWAPFTILLGLVGCSIPIPLKADLLLTLSALSKSPENASQMWENLESSQILLTIPTTSSYLPRGIQTELDEIESRMEEYPLTRAFLNLLDVLTDYGIPRTLGAGPRKPGFDPYLSFIINSVFLKLHLRSYRNMIEKWQLVKLCLKLFEKFFNQYDPQIADFPNKNSEGMNEFNSPPGYHLMVQMNNKSELLNVILDIVNEGNHLFDSYVNFSGQELVQACTLSCLNILHSVLLLQNKFINCSVASSSPILLININSLLFTINRNSGKPDHCINIIKYVTYQPLLIKHSLIAIKIITHIINAPLLHNEFLTILLASEYKNEIKSNFVQSLDEMVENDFNNDYDLIIKIKIEILKLLKQCLQYNTTPNLSHFLLGFDIKHGDISRIEFQYPGVLDFPRTCLHSIISILDLELNSNNNINEIKLLELSYEMIYLLSSNGKTYKPILRFLRLNQYFFINHLKKLITNINLNLKQLSWLMKTLAIEIKISSQNRQITYLKQITNCLISLPKLDENDLNQDPFAPINTSNELINNTNNNNRSLRYNIEVISSNFMIKLIDHFHLINNNEIEMPTWQFFDNKVLNKRLKNCEIDTNDKLIDLKKLHQILYDELKQLQGTTVIGQIQSVQQEIPKVLKYALNLNKLKENYLTHIQFINGWRQLVEILILYLPNEVISINESQMISICFLTNLLKRIVKFDLLPEISQYLSETILLIFDNLKKNHRYEKLQRKVNIINDSNRTITTTTILEMNLGLLKDVLNNLIDWIIISNITDEKLRINLYVSLINLLELTNIQDLNDLNRHYGSNHLLLDCLMKFDDKLIEIICQDCIGGYEVSNILALSSFSLLIHLSGNINWILYLSGRGYLKYIIQSILDSDKELESLLESNRATVKPLYVYMAKFLFLIRLSNNKMGAELLLKHKIFSCFGEMKIYSFHPEITKQLKNEINFDNFIPTINEQYLQIWLPTLEICNTIITTLGNKNQSAITQIWYFILSHFDGILLILRSANPLISLTSLKELLLLISVLSHIANNNLSKFIENFENSFSQLYQIQKLILSLLYKFILTDSVLQKLTNQKSNNMFECGESSEHLLYVMQVISYLLCYSRNIISNHNIEHGIGVIFHPTLNDPTLNTDDGVNDINFNEPLPSLGVIVQQLITMVKHYSSQKFIFDYLNRTIKELSIMNGAEINELSDFPINVEDINMKREYLYKKLSERLYNKRKELDYLIFIIENTIYLIWFHLDYYMLKAIPKMKNYESTVIKTALPFDSTLASASEATWKVSTDTISNLKHGLVSIFNDSFNKKLTEIIQDFSEIDKQFVETLLKKIIRLLQFVPVK